MPHRVSRGGDVQVVTNGRRSPRSPLRRAAYPARYSALGLLRRGLTHSEWPPAWRAHPRKGSYDVVIVGGGVHGLAAAYYLAANHGITDVAVLDKGYMGSGGSGRNTAILRSNYLTPEGVRFYDRSIQLYRTLAADLDYNVMFSRRGHLTLAHSDASLRTMRWRAEVNKGPAGGSTLIADMAGVAMRITTSPLQAAVTEPVKPFLSPVIVSGTLHVYISQTDRGELVFGASVDPFTSYSMRGSLEFIEGLAGHVLELMPALTKVRVLRQWAGLCDMTPDFSPVMGHTPVPGLRVHFAAPRSSS